MLAGNSIVKSSYFGEVTVDEQRLVAHLAIERRKKMSSLMASTYFVNGRYILLVLTVALASVTSLPLSTPPVVALLAPLTTAVTAAIALPLVALCCRRWRKRLHASLTACGGT